MPTLSDEVKHAPAAPGADEMEDTSEGFVMTSAGLVKWGITLLALLILSTWGLVSLLSNRAEQEASVTSNPPVPVVRKPVGKDEEAAPSKDLQHLDTMKLSERMKETAQAFLQAKTREEALQYAWEPERVKPLWDQFQAGQAYDAPGFSSVDEASIMAPEDGVTTCSVTLGDFSSRAMSFRLVGDTLKVDWESWVGWCEMSAREFQQQRPSQPKLFRVIVSKVRYYNFDFSDEGKWVSYRLESLDGQLSLYGYLPLDSPINARIRTADDLERKQVTVKLRFPENPQTRNQVVIDSLISESWVEKSSK
jgi:hypothetical protein